MILVSDLINKMLPELNSKDNIILAELKERYPRQFHMNVTNFFVSEMAEYIRNNQVWRIAIMGETRGGKSEGGQSVCFLYRDMFNHYLKNGFIKGKNKVDFKEQISSKMDTSIKVEAISFTTDHICDNQSNYLYSIRTQVKEESLKFGQIWLIDENRENSGLGSYSEKLESDNLNNIIAKFCQSEVWITPRRFVLNNTPYGLRAYKKDMIRRVNWFLLYKINMTPEGIEYNFLGWVDIPLHKNEKHRAEYEQKKNSWIKKEMAGNVDDRMRLRHEIAGKLSEDEDFKEPNAKLTNFKRNTKQQKAILERWIIEGKSQNFNELEKESIVNIARDLALKYL